MIAPSNQMIRTKWNKGLRGIAVAVCAAAAVAAVGCGSDRSSSSEDAPTKVVFVKEADKLCQKADARQLAGLKLYSEKHQPKGSTQAWEEQLAVAVGLPPLEIEARELAGLTPPSGDEDEIDAIVTAIEEAVEDTKDEPAGALKQPGKNSFAAAEKMARDYGLKVCGEI